MNRNRGRRRVRFGPSLLVTLLEYLYLLALVVVMVGSVVLFAFDLLFFRNPTFLLATGLVAVMSAVAFHKHPF